MVMWNRTGARQYIVSATRVIGRKIVYWTLGFTKADSEKDLKERLNLKKLLSNLEKLQVSVYFTDIEEASTREEMAVKVRKTLEDVLHTSIQLDSADMGLDGMEQIFTREGIVALIRRAID